MRNIVGKTLLTLVIIATASLNTTYANELDSKIAFLNKETTINVTDIVVNKTEQLNHLRRIVKNDLEKINKNDTKIENLNQIVFFYSEKNIVDIVQAVKDGEISPTPVLQFENAQTGYPIYNGVLKKIGHLAKENYTLKQAVKKNQYKITMLENQLAQQNTKIKRQKPLFALNQTNYDISPTTSF